MCSQIQIIFNLFIEKCGKPQSDDALSNYISFVFEKVSQFDSTEYCEKHHILPRAAFSEFINCEWNIVNLTYSNHIIAHELLFKAYPTRQNQRTLNFMKSPLNKNTELISSASIFGWKKLKSNTEKFEKFKEARRNHMINASTDEHKKRGQAAWKSIKSNTSQYLNFCNSAKNSWTDDRKLHQSKKISEWIKNNPGKLSIRSKKYWDNKSIEDREKFKAKITETLSSPEIRKKISLKLKNKWEDNNFKEKMKSRKKYLQKLEIISPTGETYYRDGLIEMIREFDFSPSLVRKFTNSGKPVSSNYLKNKQVQNTIGWTFKKIN